MNYSINTRENFAGTVTAEDKSMWVNPTVSKIFAGTSACLCFLLIICMILFFAKKCPVCEDCGN